MSSDVRDGSWLRENSEIEFANRNFVSTSINLKNKSAGDGCREKTIEKTILRTFRAQTFSRSQGRKRTFAAPMTMSAYPSGSGPSIVMHYTKTRIVPGAARTLVT